MLYILLVIGMIIMTLIIAGVVKSVIRAELIEFKEILIKELNSKNDNRNKNS